MKKEIKQTLDQNLKADLSNYLTENKFIDIAAESKSIYWFHTKKPTEINYNFDYDTLTFNRLIWENIGSEYFAKIIIWRLDSKVIEFKGFKDVRLNNNNVKIEGMINLVTYKVTFDQNTGDPIVNLMNSEFNLEHKKIYL